MLTLHFFFWLLNIPLLMSNLTHPKCFWRMKQNEDKPGEVVTGFVFYLIAVQSKVEKTYFPTIVLFQTNENYQFALPLAFAVEEINRNLYLLPNVSLIFYFFTDNYNDKKSFQKFAKWSRLPLNYICKNKNKCSVMITGPTLAPSLSLAHFLQVFKDLQLTYGPFHSILSDHEQFPNLYQMAPKDTALALAMVSLMLHFKWNWIGLAISNDDQGLQFLSDLREKSEVQRVCLAFVIVIPVNMELYMSRAEVYNNQIETSSTNVVIIYGDTESTLAVCFRMWKSRGIQRIWMNQKEKPQAEYGIYHISNFPHGVGLKVKIGEFMPYFPHGQQLHLYEDMIEWVTRSRQMPSAVCSVDCHPGFRKIHQEGMAACCFDCTPCPANEISNETDMDQCLKCPEDQYANAQQNHCLHKDVIFLAFDDPLGMTLSCMALCLSAFTVLVLGIFVKHQDTPIVKANNLTLSYILLISLIFCFLCSLLFIGYPNSATCILQQITYGVLFTVAVSTVLAKTIIVVLAFKVTTPGRRMKWLLVSGAPTYIIPICTIIQIILCAIWLGTSPPSVDIDAHSEHGHIIIVCNKGSVTAFYSVLGYLGSLALGSFTVAFLARNLPDTFNEAKFMTFSMLLFCSVWVTFLPVYQSTKGKVMVAVEVFSILASSAGLLGCVFVPKCYIILLRPERNSLQKLREKSSSRTHIS
nr:vomeronasal type-2 receptor 116-like [Peromyscus maniculatus bairdii]